MQKQFNPQPKYDLACLPINKNVNFGFIPQLNLDDYCFCVSSTNQSSGSMNTEQTEETKVEKVKRRKRNPLLMSKNLESSTSDLIRVLNSIDDTHNYVVFANRKAAQKAGGPVGTRSRYIGVSRNGKAWQSLISIRKRKTYIGTFDDERHAALAFDFYSILLCGLSAVTNFNYTKQEIFDMLQNYNTNNNKFNPESFRTFQMN